MNRRGFLGTLLAGLTLDPERALWVPGRKLISIPAAGAFTRQEIKATYRILNQLRYKWTNEMLASGLVRGYGFFPHGEYSARIDY